MSNYYIFIDETGNFNKLNDRSNNFVGGFVSKDFSVQEFENKISNVSNEVNKDLPQEKHFDYKKNMHFIPLHIYNDKRREEENITFPVNKAETLINKIFNSVKDNIYFTFRSKGFVRYLLDGESIYRITLISTLFQVINYIREKDKSESISVNILIASRKIFKNEYGSTGDFIQKLRTDLIQELGSFSEIKLGDILIKRAIDDIGLSLSDLVCGALTSQFKKNDYLRNIETKIFPVRQFSTMIKSSYNTFLSLLEYDTQDAVLFGLESLSFSYNKDLESQLLDLIPNLIKNSKNELISEINSILEQMVLLNKDKYLKLDEYIKYSDTLRNYLANSGDKNFNLTLELILQKYEIKLVSHKGKNGLDVYNRYLDNLNKNGYLLYKNAYLIAQENLEALLKAVPISFNSFDFEYFEDRINEEDKKYQIVFNINNKYDENLAKIKGSTGQMYAFLSDMYKITDPQKSKEYFEIAESELLEDEKYTVPDLKSYDYTRALGYLISLYFKQDNLDKCIEYFNRLTLNDSSKKIYNLGELIQYNNGFSLLQRLYISSLSLKTHGTRIFNLNLIKDQMNLDSSNLAESIDITKYPNILSAKWLGVIYFIQNQDYETALKLFDKASEIKKDEFVIRIIKLSIRVLKYYTQLKLNGDSVIKQYKNEIKTELDVLDSEVEGIKAKLSSIGLNENILDNWQDKDIFELACILPFNYA